jgi:hypothetical protein
MKKILLFVPAVLFFHSSCDKQSVTAAIDLKGGWFVDHIIDKTTGNSEPSRIPADSVIIYFLNDSAYEGRTHHNMFGSVYTYNGDSLITFKYPIFTLLPYDTLGERFLNVLRTCHLNNYPCPPGASHIELLNHTLVIDTKDKYTAFLKKI